MSPAPIRDFPSERDRAGLTRSGAHKATHATTRPTSVADLREPAAGMLRLDVGPSLELVSPQVGPVTVSPVVLG